jgi:uncharacterized protein HemY
MPVAYVNLSKLYQSIDPPDVKKAAAVLERGTKVITDDPTITFTLAKLYIDENEHMERAVDLLEVMVQKYPEEATPRYYLGKAYAATGKKKQACAQFEWLSSNFENLRSQALVEIDNLK